MDETIDQIRKQGHEIESHACDIELLLKTVMEKLDGGTDGESIATIDCLVRCALNNVGQLKNHHYSLMCLTVQQRAAA